MKDLNLKAKILIWITLLTGGLASIHYFFHLGEITLGLGLLASLAALLQIFKVEGATEKSSYNLGWLVYGFAFLQYGAPETLFVILVAHLAEWAWHKYPWFIQSYNISSFALAITAATLVSNAIYLAPIPSMYRDPLGFLSGIVVFTLCNHLMIGLVIWFARGQNLKESAVFDILSLTIDFTILAFGGVTAMLWGVNPITTIFMLAPVYLFQNALKTPSLKRQTEIDPKTKLYNADYFAEKFKKELERAQEYNHPLTVVLGDLDLLRNINNTYGHLAGDVVLVGIADILKKSFRVDDLVARFGGEEFAILMPNTLPEVALERVEMVREKIEAADFEVDTSVHPIKATISFGISGIEGTSEKQLSTKDLVNDADTALYSAKLNGRNKTCTYPSDEIEELFHIKHQQENIHSPLSNENRLKTYPVRPNPIREEPEANPEIEVNHKPKVTRAKPSWKLNRYLGVVILVAIAFGLLGLPHISTPDFYGILIFSVVILLSEVFSIEIYTKDSSVSTAAVPLIAGTLLFGPMGALILSIVIATTATIKKRSNLIRLLFNTSNHFISSSLLAFVLLPIGKAFSSYPVWLQLVFALAAGIAMFFSSTLLLTGVLHLSKRQPFIAIWTDHFKWLLPYYITFGLISFLLILGYSTAGFVGLAGTMVPLLMLRFSQVQYIDNTKNMVSQLHTKNTELEENNTLITTLNEDILLSLANTIELRDPFTMGHSNGVANLAVLIAKEMGLPSAWIDKIHKAGLLHDIGKIGIPDAILFKPGSLTYSEFDQIKTHPCRGSEIVAINHLLSDLSPIIRHHHERYDGAGYPDNLQGEAIPLGARILCVADSLQAMLSDRPYRKGIFLQEALVEIQVQSGSQFDPLVVTACLGVLQKDHSDYDATFKQHVGDENMVDALFLKKSG